ncbi:CBS domain-containing protein [Patescibacteria group bacterium]|nr:MAG: CBS domain-containing protein [Patescibacteria group bacterium]
MKVRDVMEKNVIAVKKGATYEEVARILDKQGIKGAPVVDENNVVIGVVSEKDLYKILYPFYSSFYDHPELYVDFENRESKIDEVRGKKVEEFMSRNTVSVSPDSPVMRAGAMMIAKGVHRLPVIENGKLVGIVTRSKIYRTLLRNRLAL